MNWRKLALLLIVLGLVLLVVGACAPASTPTPIVATPIPVTPALPTVADREWQSFLDMLKERAKENTYDARYYAEALLVPPTEREQFMRTYRQPTPSPVKIAPLTRGQISLSGIGSRLSAPSHLGPILIVKGELSNYSAYSRLYLTLTAYDRNGFVQGQGPSPGTWVTIDVPSGGTAPFEIYARYEGDEPASFKLYAKIAPEGYNILIYP